ncbi:MAG: hypothetical protein AMK72_05280 [Planctomycetes bacterium SM23_25]|nr:MAG: hypothetical protein AMS14_03605 [Planctomycetes bacterium DG_20]KPK49128.1 MAG: hypothetical protein AMK72_05280 [Planctomycetes bacterium SM23_25]
MTSKERAVQIISGLPDDATAGDIIAELYVQMKVETGLRELNEGRGIPHEQVKERLQKWLT